MNLEGKVAIVTGAGRGIGAASACRLAEAGALVSCVDIDSQPALETAEAITARGDRAIGLGADVSSQEANDEIVARTVEAFGAVDVLHANAAFQRITAFEDTSPADWQRMFATNLYGVALGVTAALPHFRSRGGGSVIITASVLGIVGDGSLGAYGATKGGLRALCRSLAAAYGPDNVRVNTICPGDVETRLVQDFLDNQPDPELTRDRIERFYPLGRFATPRDIAGVVAFLASADADYITGTDIVVDGGLLAKAY